MDYKMKIATIEKFFGENETRKIYNQDKRDETLKKFPFTEANRDAFIIAVPSFGLGERYDD